MPINIIDTVHWILVLLFPICLVAAMIQDIRTLEISNKISIVLAAVFLFCALISDISLNSIFIHYGMGMAMFMVGALLFFLGIIGGGDVKLLAATSIWFSTLHVITLLLIMAIIGGLLGLLVLLLRRFTKENRLKEIFPWLLKDEGLPYGVAIGIAGLYLFPEIPVLPVSLVNSFGF